MTPIRTINANGQVYDFDERPLVMGILNHTPDSFFSGSRVTTERAIHERIEQILSEGGTVVDVGGYSSRPDASEVSSEEEWARVEPVLNILKHHYSQVPVSVDTFRSGVARRAIEHGGAHIINDVSGGGIDPKMFHTVADLGVPYILMHMRGTPKTMQQMCHYRNSVADEVISELRPKVETLRSLGVRDIVIDPGFGFSKTTEQNYRLMSDLPKFVELGLPLLVGISRKSMIYRLLGGTPDTALTGTTALNTFALLHGADVLRVHDVREAVEVVRIVGELRTPQE